MGLFMDEDEHKEELNYWENYFVSVCPVCKGAREILNNQGGVDGCDCVRRAHIYANLITNGVPRTFIDWKWNNCDKADPITLQQCKEYVLNFDNNFKNCQGMYIFGTQGVGKTTLATLIAKYVAFKKNPYKRNRRYQVAFASYDKLIIWDKNTFNIDMQQKLNTFINKAELAVIDNVGGELITPATVKLLDRIIRERRNNGYPTIITANFTLSEMQKHYGDAIKDFISQSFNQMPVIGENIRANDNFNDVLSGIEDLGDDN